MRRRLGSPHDMINAWSTARAIREAIEGSERFTTIDPERVGMYLAGECIPAERASLEAGCRGRQGRTTCARGNAIRRGRLPRLRVVQRLDE